MRLILFLNFLCKKQVILNQKKNSLSNVSKKLEKETGTSLFHKKTFWLEPYYVFNPPMKAFPFNDLQAPAILCD